MLKTYVIPFDGSDNSKEALKFALLSGSKKDEYILVNVQKQSEHTLLNNYDEETINSRLTEIAKGILAQADEFLNLDKYNIVKEVCLGYPAIEITNLAKERNAHSIIMGSRGLSPSIGKVLGSVTNSVIHLSQCPVTIVPANKND